MITSKLRRTALATTAALLVAGGSVAAGVASADTAETVEPTDVTQSLRLRASERYWACLAIDHVDIGTCVENPLPDLNDYGSVPQIVGSLTGG